MKTKRSSLSFILLALIALSICIFIFLYHFIPHSTGITDFDTAWSNNIKQKGAQQAYNQFKQQYQNSPVGTQHMYAHLFGSLLYQREGLSGISICDDSLSYGCYHSFLSAAIQDHGLSIITKLESICDTSFPKYPAPCVHGIGHGVMAYFEDTDLARALQTCSLLKHNGPYDGCMGGIFMEYNLKSMQNPTFTPSLMRPFDGTNPFAPCPDLPTMYQLTCYERLPEWWNFQLGLGKHFKEMGDLCGQIENFLYKNACYEGIGSSAYFTGMYNNVHSLSFCNALSDATGKSICIQQVNNNLKTEK